MSKACQLTPPGTADPNWNLLLRALVAPIVLLLSVALSYTAALGTAALLFHALGHLTSTEGCSSWGSCSSSPSASTTPSSS